jgi:hypothetical protein
MNAASGRFGGIRRQVVRDLIMLAFLVGLPAAIWPNRPDAREGGALLWGTIVLALGLLAGLRRIARAPIGRPRRILAGGVVTGLLLPVLVLGSLLLVVRVTDASGMWVARGACAHCELEAGLRTGQDQKVLLADGDCAADSAGHDDPAIGCVPAGQRRVGALAWELGMGSILMWTLHVRQPSSPNYASDPWAGCNPMCWWVPMRLAQVRR